ncbi:hypothetical protein HDE_12199 [Halotydeus destructor]|nr:hypothetical protein HDE_12199 [Halotydeus destructor]
MSSRKEKKERHTVSRRRDDEDDHRSRKRESPRERRTRRSTRRTPEARRSKPEEETKTSKQSKRERDRLQRKLRSEIMRRSKSNRKSTRETEKPEPEVHQCEHCSEQEEETGGQVVTGGLPTNEPSLAAASESENNQKSGSTHVSHDGQENGDTERHVTNDTAGEADGQQEPAQVQIRENPIDQLTRELENFEISEREKHSLAGPLLSTIAMLSASIIAYNYI